MTVWVPLQCCVSAQHAIMQLYPCEIYCVYIEEGYDYQQVPAVQGI